MESVSRSEQAAGIDQDKTASRRVLYETVIVLVGTLAAQLLWKDFSILFALVPTAYFLIERDFRRRTWAELGSNFRATPRDVTGNWFLVLLVSVVIQSLVVWTAKAWMPALLDPVDSVFYGIVFARTHNVYASWMAHLLANLFAIGSFLLV